jgi:hypothetical protein|tara:strand:+ start:698 stop:898 length:201 start_codon:yes stop_codon:yes gene_type:complete
MTNKITNIEQHLDDVGHISTREALLDYGIVSLRDAIYKLRRKGVDIMTEQRVNPVNNKIYTRYWKT